MSPRMPRIEISTYTHFHICIRGNNRENIFLDDGDRIRFLGTLERCRGDYKIDCYAYCLMTNHVHLLVRSPSVKFLSKMMHRISSSYAGYFNKKHKRSGHLFQDRFSSWVIVDEEHLQKAKEYIENNPVSAGISQRREDYPWGSAGIRDGSVVTLSEI